MSAPTTSAAASLSARLLVYGLGRSGSAVVQRARAAGQRVWFYEARQTGEDVERSSALGAERVHDVNAWLNESPEPGLVVAAPGVPSNNPDLIDLRAGNAEVIGEVEWVFRQVPGRYIGITGTAGKGSVTRWCGDTLTAAGYDVVVGGNIVPALAAVAQPGAVHVVEMSSFQLERCPMFAPDVAVVLNLGEDHIDRHGSVAAYHAAKKNLLKNLTTGHTLVINADDPQLTRWGDEAEARGVRVLRFSLDAAWCRGAQAEGATPNAAVTADQRALGAWPDPDGSLRLFGQVVANRADLRVAGDHQLANALAMLLACSAMGVPTEHLITGLKAFAGLPGRYSPAGSVGNVRFIEDSIATRPLSVEAAIKATPRPLVWLAGGQAKGARVGDLATLVSEHVDLVLTFGASAETFATAFEQHTATERVVEPTGAATMRSLVRKATEYLRRQHGGHGHVLLAPLAASFDQFADYQARAQAFRDAVQEAARTPVGATGVEGA